jgi:hypothetical protein
MTVVTHANRGLVQALAGDDLNLISEPSLSEIRHVGWITVPALFPDHYPFQRMPPVRDSIRFMSVPGLGRVKTLCEKKGM